MVSEHDREMATAYFLDPDNWYDIQRDNQADNDILEDDED